MLASVIDRWRASTMSHKVGFESDSLDLNAAIDAPSLAPRSTPLGSDQQWMDQAARTPPVPASPAFAAVQPSALPQRPTVPPAFPAPGALSQPGMQRPSILRKPIAGDAPIPPSTTPRFPR